MIEAGFAALPGDLPSLTTKELTALYIAMHEARSEPSPLPDGDLVKRLRALLEITGQGNRNFLIMSDEVLADKAIIREAADTITRLEADNAAKDAVIKRAANKIEAWSRKFGATPGYEQIAELMRGDAEAFRAAIQSKEERDG